MVVFRQVLDYFVLFSISYSVFEEKRLQVFSQKSEVLDRNDIDSLESSNSFQHENDVELAELVLGAFFPYDLFFNKKCFFRKNPKIKKEIKLFFYFLCKRDDIAESVEFSKKFYKFLKI